jgi:hypothetical protein
MGNFFASAILIGIVFLVIHRMYRDKAPSWRALLEMGVSITSRADGRVVGYGHFDRESGVVREVPFLQVPFLKFDLWRIQKSGARPNLRYFDKGWAEIGQTPEFAAAVRSYEARLGRAYERNEGRPWRDAGLLARAPYAYKEESYLRSSPVRARVAGLQHVR